MREAETPAVTFSCDLSSPVAFCRSIEPIAGLEAGTLDPDATILRSQVDLLGLTLIVAAVEETIEEDFPQELVDAMETPREWFEFARIKRSHRAPVVRCAGPERRVP